MSYLSNHTITSYQTNSEQHNYTFNIEYTEPTVKYKSKKQSKKQSKHKTKKVKSKNIKQKFITTYPKWFYCKVPNTVVNVKQWIEWHWQKEKHKYNL